MHNYNVKLKRITKIVMFVDLGGREGRKDAALGHTRCDYSKMRRETVHIVKV